MSNNFAVSSSDISTALTKQSASLHAYGNDMNEVIGMVTAGAEILTGNASKTARGIKTIGANIVKMAQSAKTLDIQVAGATKTIQLWNKEGTDILSTYEVLKQIAVYWKDMTDAEKSALAIQQSGKNQLDVYTAVLGNFATAIKASETAMHSQGSAIKENTAYLESLEAKTQQFRQQLDQFVLGEGGLGQLAKNLLDIATNAMKLINSLGGLGTTMRALGAIITVALLSKTDKLIKNFEDARKSSTGLSLALKTVGVSASKTQLVLQGLALAIGVIITAYSAWKAKQEEALRSLDESYVKFKEQDDQLKKNIQTLKDESATREDLASIISETIDGYDTEHTTLEHLNAQREKAIELINEERKAKARDIVEGGLSQYKKDIGFLNSNELSFNTDRFTKPQFDILRQSGVFDARSQEEVLNALKKAQYAMNEAGKSSSYLDDVIVELSNQIDEAKGRVVEWNNSAEIAGSLIDSVAQKLHKEFKDSTLDATQQAEALQQQLNDINEVDQKLVDGQDDVNSKLDEFAEELNLTRDEVDEYINSLGEDEYEEFNSNTTVAYAKLAELAEELGRTASEFEDIADQIENVSKPLKDAEDAYSSLKTAVDEFNKTGGFSADTIQTLSQLDEDWVNLLQEVDGQLVINEDNLALLAEENRQLAIAELQAQASADMHKVAIGDVANVSPIAKKAIGELSNENSTIASTAQQATVSTLLEASAIRELKEAQAGLEGEERGDAFKNINAIKNEYQAIIDEMNNWSIKTPSITSDRSGKSSKSKETDKYLEAFKKEKEALKHKLEMDYISEQEYYESLQELNERYFGIATGLHQKYLEQYIENEEEVYKGLKSIYDQAKDYLANAVEESYQDAINILEKEEKKVLGNIKKQIDALKKESEQNLKNVKNQIEALKDEKNAVQDYWNDQIDAVKKANEELEKQNELLKLQQALAEAKAKKVMVMGEDGTFGLSENESAVASAEKNLSDYEDRASYEQQIADMEALRDAQLDNIQDRIDNLEHYYDYLKDYYDNQIDQLQDYYDRTQEVYDEEKQALQDQLDAFKESQKEYENIQNAKIATQVMAMDAESENWNTELANLRNYINQYNAMLTQLGTAGKYVGYSYEAGKGTLPTPTPVGGGVAPHARGVASVSQDEIALVGEGKNAELVIGSHANKGSLMSLQRGSGVVNAESTQTLAGVLNSLASPTPSSSNGGANVTQTFSFGNISLPNVTDADTFVKELGNKFNNYAIQYSSIRE